MAVEGRHISIAYLMGARVKANMLPVMLKRLVLTGSTLRARDKDFKGAIAGNLQEHVWPLIEAGKVTPKLYTTLPLAEAAAAHTCMEGGSHMGKIVLLTGAEDSQ